jgi:hypothetical protein
MKQRLRPCVNPVHPATRIVNAMVSSGAVYLMYMCSILWFFSTPAPAAMLRKMTHCFIHFFIRKREIEKLVSL